MTLDVCLRDSTGKDRLNSFIKSNREKGELEKIVLGIFWSFKGSWEGCYYLSWKSQELCLALTYSFEFGMGFYMNPFLYEPQGNKFYFSLHQSVPTVRLIELSAL